MDMDTLLKAARAVEAVRATRLTRDFVTAREQAVLLDWTQTLRSRLAANGRDRGYVDVRKLAEVDPCYERVRRRVEALMALGDDPVSEPKIGHYVSIIAAGGQVHRHIDATPPGTRHLRCNLFLQLPDSGGRPVILDAAVEVAPRMLLAFYPSEWPHSSERFAGTRERIILSFGYTVPDTHRLPQSPTDQPPLSA